jgi:hypothetical protein
MDDKIAQPMSAARRPIRRFGRGRSTRAEPPEPQEKETKSMRFMMLMIPKGYESAAPGIDLDVERVKSMMAYNEELQKAGVLLALDGLHPPSSGARVTFATGKPVVTDGPFAEAKEVLGGYWMIQVNSREEAIEWAKRCPATPNEIIEIRQVQEMSDYSEEVAKAAAAMPDIQTTIGQKKS